MTSRNTTNLITVALAIASVVLLSVLLISLGASMSGDLGGVHHIAAASAQSR